MTKRQIARLTVLDVLLVAALLALPGWALLRSWHAARGPREALVYQDNRLVGVYQLDRDQTILIGDKARPHMRVEIRNGAIRVAESDCPKGVCKHAGWVRTPGRSIICVPNRVLIEVKGKSKDYDAEAY
ncbi:NusG domain II-containing protein [candidate division WOR-3 bacterium]|nr:NusG domain II-containing protein [candidate division WOR-3 bacterium]